MRIILAGIALALAAPANADPVPWIDNGYQSIVGFDNVALGTTAFRTGGIPTSVSGGAVTLGTPANPAQSGAQVYGGTSILITVGPAQQDLIDYSWPDFGAFVTGTTDILLELSAFDYNLQVEVPVFATLVGPGISYLSGGSTDFWYGFYTSARFSSAEYFTMDTLALGLPNVAPGVPEPATWALLIGGFGLTGTALRRRRGVAA